MKLEYLQSLLFSLFFLFQLTEASIHFYLDPKEVQCFTKDLHKDSLLMIRYKIEVLAENNEYVDVSLSSEVNVFFTVEETFDNNHMVASQKGFQNEFIFTSFDSGEHRICLRPEANGYKLNTRSRLTIDIDVGTSKLFDSPVVLQDDLRGKLISLFKKLEALKDDYKLFRIKEHQFRDLSEVVNSRVILFVVVQFIVLGFICWFQLNDLKRFFVKQKVV